MIHLPHLQRRDFLSGALASFPLALLWQSAKAPAAPVIVKVPAGEDRLGEHHTIGVSTTAYKVLTADSSGALFLFEHRNAAGKKAALRATCTTTKMNGFMSSKASTSPKSARRAWN